MIFYAAVSERMRRIQGMKDEGKDEGRRALRDHVELTAGDFARRYMWSRKDSPDESVRSKNQNTKIEKAIHDRIVGTKQNVAIRTGKNIKTGLRSQSPKATYHSLQGDMRCVTDSLWIVQIFLLYASSMREAIGDICPEFKDP